MELQLTRYFVFSSSLALVSIPLQCDKQNKDDKILFNGSFVVELTIGGEDPMQPVRISLIATVAGICNTEPAL